MALSGVHFFFFFLSVTPTFPKELFSNNQAAHIGCALSFQNGLSLRLQEMLNLEGSKLEFLIAIKSNARHVRQPKRSKVQSLQTIGVMFTLFSTWF